MIDLYVMPFPTCATLVISPHLDDAVFSCGAMLAAQPDTTVCTIFAGAPRAACVTDWDKQCGFEDAHQAMHARRKEDTAALQVLDARALHLDFLDSQYTSKDDDPSARIATAIDDAIRETHCDTLYIPLGLFHSDHAIVHDATRSACLSNASVACIAYEDCLYRRMDGLLQKRFAELFKSGIEATPLFEPIDSPSDMVAKQRAVECYVSQLRAFGPHGYDDVYAPERFWTLRAIGSHV